MTAKIMQLTPCAGWNFIHKDGHSGKLYIHPVAAWALLEDGEVVGMISGDSREPMTPGKTATLVRPPAVGGYYAPVES